MGKDGAEVSNKVVVSLVVIALLVSLSSTLIIGFYVKNVQPLTIQNTIQKNVVVQPPVQSTGFVSISVLPNNQRGNFTNGK